MLEEIYDYSKKYKKGLDYVHNLVEDSENGRWVTIKGTHVLIKKGQSIGEVISKKFGKKKEKKKKEKKKKEKKVKKSKKSKIGLIESEKKEVRVRSEKEIQEMKSEVEKKRLPTIETKLLKSKKESLKKEVDILFEKTEKIHKQISGIEKSSMSKEALESVLNSFVEERDDKIRRWKLIRDELSSRWDKKDLTEKNIPKKDGSGKGKRANKGRGECEEEEQEEEGKGVDIPREVKKKDLIITNDFMPFRRVNDSTLGGYIVRDGPFLYGKEVKYKEWDNLKQVYGNLTHAIAYGSKQNDSHTESNDRFIGFFDSFELVPKGSKGPFPDKDGNYIDNKFNRVAARLNTSKDIKDLSDLSEIMELPASASYNDLGRGNIQQVGEVFHIAVSLNKNEQDRCSTLGGSPCNMSLIGDFQEKQNLNKNNKNTSNGL